MQETWVQSPDQETGSRMLQLKVCMLQLRPSTAKYVNKYLGKNIGENRLTGYLMILRIILMRGGEEGKEESYYISNCFSFNESYLL